MKKVSASQGYHDLLNDYLLDDSDLILIRHVGKQLIPKLDLLIDDLYAWLQQRREFSQFFTDTSVLSRVKLMQRDYWECFLMADVDDDYIGSRLCVGEVHARIGLELDVYFTAMNRVYNWISSQLVFCDIEENETLNTLKAISNLLHLDTAVVAALYQERTAHQIEQQARSLMELSTPALRVWEGVVMMPLIGVIDSVRAAQVTEDLLQAIVDFECQVAILDVTGVPVIDTRIAQHLMNTVVAARMLGATVLLTGISPETAQTMSKLGINTSDFNTAGTLRAGLRSAIGIVSDTINGHVDSGGLVK